MISVQYADTASKGIEGMHFFYHRFFFWLANAFPSLCRELNSLHEKVKYFNSPDALPKPPYSIFVDKTFVPRRLGPLSGRRWTFILRAAAPLSGSSIWSESSCLSGTWGCLQGTFVQTSIGHQWVRESILSQTFGEHLLTDCHSWIQTYLLWCLLIISAEVASSTSTWTSCRSSLPSSGNLKPHGHILKEALTHILAGTEELVGCLHGRMMYG